MQLRRFYLLLLTALFCLLLLSGCGSHLAKRIPFRYQTGAEDAESYLYYTDDFFDQPSTRYDASLATASLSFALASFASTEGENYLHRYRNIEALLGQAGFSDLFVNSFYQAKPGSDSLGVVIARKPLKDKTLLYVGLRGANYESEWASNFTVGDGEKTNYHTGFFEASEIILEALKTYVESYSLSGELKLWISGYSRAGAACNLASGRMDEYIRDGVPFLGNNVSLSREDLYAYCFEAPQGVPYDETAYPKSELFQNIFCIVNRNDPVPKVVMNDLSFTRYGVELYLPDSVTHMDFKQILERLEKEYETLWSFGGWGTYQVGNFRLKTLGDGKKLLAFGEDPLVKNWTQGLFLDQLLTVWTQSGILDRENYSRQFQAGLRDIFQLMYARRSSSSSLKDLGLQLVREIFLSNESEILIDDFMHHIDKLPRDLEPLLYRALEDMGIDMDVRELVTSLTQLLGSLVKTFLKEPGLFFSCLSLDNFRAVASAHYPELCLAFLRIMDPLYTKDPVETALDGKYYLLKADAGSDILVERAGTAVAGFRGGLPLECDSSLAYGLRQNEIYIYLPVHETYEALVTSAEGLQLFLVDPGRLAETEISLSPSPAEGGYRFAIPAG